MQETPISVEELGHHAHVVNAIIRRGLADDRCRLVREPRNFSCIFSLAALSHESMYLEHLIAAVENEFDRFVIALLVRHHLETWATGVYLLFEGLPAVELLLAEANRSDIALRAEFETLCMTGKYRLPELPPGELSEWGRGRWKYDDVFRRLEELGELNGLLRAAVLAYPHVYRPLSGQLGAHPTAHVLEKYIDSGNLCASIDERGMSPFPEKNALHWCVMLTAVHASWAFGDRGFDVDSLSDLVTKLKIPSEC